MGVVSLDAGLKPSLRSREFLLVTDLPRIRQSFAAWRSQTYVGGPSWGPCYYPAVFERASLAVIRVCRKFLRNTWVHRLPLTERLYRQLFSHVYHGVEKEVQFRGSSYVIPTSDITIAPSLLSGEFERFELSLFEQVLRPEMTVLDIGANIGIYSINAARRIRPGRVYAFEPVPENVSLLERNIGLNGLDNVDVVRNAVGERQGVVPIFLSRTIGSHSLARMNALGIVGRRPRRGTSGEDWPEHLDVPMITIDQFVADRSLDVSVIKMDIEGYEGFACAGARETLSKRPVFFMEFSETLIRECGFDPKALIERLLRTYEFSYRIDERRAQLSRIGNVSEVEGLWNENLIFLPYELPSAH
jgi:FkbM family methyltransferase